MWGINMIKLQTAGNKKNDHENLAGYGFVLPWIIGFMAFTLIPMACLLYFAFTKYDLLSLPQFIGLDNFKGIFEDEKFYQSLKVTFKYVLISVPLRLIVALGVAILLNRRFRLIGVYRTLFYIPSIIGGSVAVAVMWGRIFSRDGAINSLINMILGIKVNLSWIADPNTALYSLILLSIWQFGAAMVIFLAGLKNISAEYYEAAVVDGANVYQKFFRITLPILTPVILFNLVMQIIGGFMTFTQGLVITNGGPMDQTLFFQLYVYRRGFQFFEMGYAAALSCIMLVIVSLFTALIFRSSKAWVHYE
jgi:multiple sugar transport system permease protein